MASTAHLNRAAVESLMEALGVDSVAELARRSGIERSYLSRVMRGARPVRPSHVVAIARALQVPTIALIGPADPDAALAALAAETEQVA